MIEGLFPRPSAGFENLYALSLVVLPQLARTAPLPDFEGDPDPFYCDRPVGLLVSLWSV